VTGIDAVPLFGEPDRTPVPAPRAVKTVQWSTYRPGGRVQCMHCVQLVHNRRGAGRIDIRTARRRRLGPDGELLLCDGHADLQHAADMNAGLVPKPRHAARRTGRRAS
jgi:hypothetical protein